MDYLERIYSGWLGKILGVTHGAPIEFWRKEKIEKFYGKINFFMNNSDKYYPPDDDINGPIFFHKVVKYIKNRDIGRDDLENIVLNYVTEGKDFFWWGGLGYSTEHTAYSNLLNGIENSGSMENNGQVLSEQIGGQIFSDCWGLLYPKDEKKAGEIAKIMSSITHDGEGIQGGIFVAASVAAAFNSKDTLEVIERALNLLDKNSIYYNMGKEILASYYNKESLDEVIEKYFQKYGPDKYGDAHIIPNGMIILIALLYGENDFTKTLCLSNQLGVDTDCNTGNVGTIMGVLKGIEGIDKEWIKKLNDRVFTSSVMGSENTIIISKLAKETFDYYRYLSGEINILEESENIYDFKLPHSTGGLEISGGEVININGNLRVINPEMTRYSDIKLTINSLPLMNKFGKSRYGLPFSPRFYSGNIIKFNIATIHIENDPKIKFIGLAKFTDGSEIEIEVREKNINEKEKSISFQIPEKENAFLLEASLIIKINLEEDTFRSVAGYIEFSSYEILGLSKLDLQLSKTLFYEYDDYKAKPIGLTTSNGNFKIEEKGLFCYSPHNRNFFLTGNSNFKSFTSRVELERCSGKLEIMFKVSGLRNKYSLEIEKDKLKLIKVQNTEVVLFEKYIENSEEIKSVKIENLEDKIEIFLNDLLEVSYVDKDTLKHGAFGIGVEKGVIGVKRIIFNEV